MTKVGMSDISPKEHVALAQIATITSPERLKRFIANARKERSDLVEAEAFRRLCFVAPEATPGTVEHDVWQAITALETELSREREKTIRLSRTRQKISRHAEAKTAGDLSRKAERSSGFDGLINRGYSELTFEAVVLRHPKTFDPETRQAAADKLRAAGIDPHAIQSEEAGHG